jgi:hypothetical protein
MKKYILALILLAIFQVEGLTQPRELKNKILWDENRPLTWKDFKGSPDEKSSFKALTAAGLYYSAEQVSEDEVKVTVTPYFDPHKSWRKKKEVNDNLLEHEQHHFDQWELSSRLFIEKLMGIESSEIKTMLKKIKEEYSQVTKEYKRVSQDYDKETDHGTNKRQQETWNKNIRSLLSATKEFDLQSVTIKLTTAN